MKIFIKLLDKYHILEGKENMSSTCRDGMTMNYICPFLLVDKQCTCVCACVVNIIRN